MLALPPQVTCRWWLLSLYLWAVSAMITFLFAIAFHVFDCWSDCYGAADNTQTWRHSFTRSWNLSVQVQYDTLSVLALPFNLCCVAQMQDHRHLLTALQFLCAPERSADSLLSRIVCTADISNHRVWYTASTLHGCKVDQLGRNLCLHDRLCFVHGRAVRALYKTTRTAGLQSGCRGEHIQGP